MLRVYRVDMRSLDDVYKAVCRKCGREFKTGNHPEQSAFCGRQCKNDWFMAVLKEERRRKRELRKREKERLTRRQT